MELAQRLSVTLRPLLRDLARVDRSKLSFVTASRNTIGVAAPLAVGAATGNLLAGLTIAIGALQVAFSDQPGPFPYRQRAGRMMLAGLCAAVSVFVGSATGALDGLAVALAALWGFGGGLLVALGAAATQIGLTSIVLLLIFAARPLPPGQAAATAGLILAGGVLQTALAVAAWPVRPFGPPRLALAAVFRRLAAFARAPAGPGVGPPATAEITQARATLAAVDGDHSATGEALHALLDEAERLRLEVLALADARHQLRGDGGDVAASGWIDGTLEASGAVLEALATGLTNGDAPSDTAAPLRRIAAAAQALARQAGGAADRVSGEASQAPATHTAALPARVEALGGQLRAAVRIATEDSAETWAAAALVEAARPPHLRPRAPLAILRANLTLRSAACRHALRLAVCLAIADALTRGLGLPRSYWVPMTAAIVLKPDFAATFTRGLGRSLGTALGLLVATALVHLAFGAVADRIVLVGLLIFIIRGLGPANYGLLVVAVTALVVVLTSFTGAAPGATIAERGVDTLIGGVLALGTYALWPTWERTQAPAILADLLDSYRRYFAAVLAGYLDPARYDPAGVEEARQAARVARTNAEASLDRLRGEPARSAHERDRAGSVLANSHRFARGVMALESGLYHNAVTPPAAPPDAPHGASQDRDSSRDTETTPRHDPDSGVTGNDHIADREATTHDDEAVVNPALRAFGADVETTLRALSATLRDAATLPDTLPDLRADQRAVADHVGADTERSDGEPPPSSRLALLATETDRITDSVNTLAGLVRA